MQQEKISKHQSKSTTEWLWRHNIHLLDWASRSPDLKPLEMLWNDMKGGVPTVAELKQFRITSGYKFNFTDFRSVKQ